MTLVEFLAARLDEDERIARAATQGPWRYNPRKEWLSPPLSELRRQGVPVGGEEFVGAGSDATVGVAATGPSDDPQSMADAAYIARHDPPHVLAQVKGDRLIVELHTPLAAGSEYGCPKCWEGVEDGEPAESPCLTLRALALPYADHPDYDPAWRVGDGAQT